MTVTARQPPRSTSALTDPRRAGSIRPPFTYRAMRNPATAPATLPEVAQAIPQPAPNNIPATIPRGMRGMNNRLAMTWTARKTRGAAGERPSAAASAIGSNAGCQRQTATAPTASTPINPILVIR